MIRPRRGPAALLLGLALAAPPAARAQSRLAIAYLGLSPAAPPPSAALVPPPARVGISGAELAISDTNTTGRFTGQTFALAPVLSPDPAALRAAFARALAAGERLFVVDAPAETLLQLADLPAARDAIIMDATSADDRLRNRDCRANMLHMLPSRAMLTDALMQYLVKKSWTSIMLLAGTSPRDALYAAAIRASAAKFQLSLDADRSWTFNPAAQQADTGHYQVNDEVAKATQGASFQVLIVADEENNFGDDVPYRTEQPRPVAGTQGLVATAWAAPMDEFGSTQIQLRFRDLAHRAMLPADYGAWLAVRAIGEAATRTASTDPARIIAYLRGPDFTLAGYKGPEFTFRPWDGQLRQPVLLADAHSIVSVSPQPGFLHENDELDSLGTDKPETQCHMSPPQAGSQP